MKIYELTCIISPEITSEKAESASKDIESFIKDKGGIILKSEKTYPKTLAYPIKKQSSGFFSFSEFQLEAEHITELKEKIQKNNEIIRHMIVINNPVKAQKERRTRKKSLTASSFSAPAEKIKEKNIFAQANKKINKKVELKEIEKELEEILSE